MASYNTVITNEGAALLASVIANQGTLTFSEMRFSTTDYDGVEQTLTVGTFAGVFITAAASGSVVDATTIKVGAQFDNSGIVGDHPLYSIGIVGTDGNTTALIAVCTTTNPDIIRAALTGVSTYAFNVNLAVSSTNNITVTGTTAAVLYDTDVVDNLTSTATNKPLSANQGRLIADNLAANENVYGAKNLWNIEKWFNDIGQAFTKSGDVYTTTISDARTNTNKCVFSDTDIEVTLSAKLTASGSMAFYVDVFDSNDQIVGGISLSQPTFTGVGCKVRFNFNATGTVTLTAPMLRDARILDPTFVPYAQTNLQLTNNKAERADLATLKLTGSTNTTGAQIDTGTFFYLNGSFCKALQNIAVNAAFTENTNYKKDTVGNLLVKTKEIQIPAGDFGTFPLNASGHAFPHTILDYTGIAKERIISIMQIDTYVVNGFFSYEMYGNGLYVMASKTDAGDYTYLNGANATLRIAYI